MFERDHTLRGAYSFPCSLIISLVLIMYSSLFLFCLIDSLYIDWTQHLFYFIIHKIMYLCVEFICDIEAIFNDFIVDLYNLLRLY